MQNQTQYTQEQRHEYRMKKKELDINRDLQKQSMKEFVTACHVTKQKQQEIEILKLKIELETLKSTRKRKIET